MRENCCIRIYSGLYFPALGLNTERYFVSLRIQSQCGKMRTKITPNYDSFCAVCFFEINYVFRVPKDCFNTHNPRYFKRSPFGLIILNEMILLKDTPQFPRLGDNLIEDYFIDNNISRYFEKLFFTISRYLPSHNSLTDYINRILDGKSLEEANNAKLCRFYSHQRITESNVGKEEKPVDYTRISRVNEFKQV